MSNIKWISTKDEVPKNNETVIYHVDDTLVCRIGTFCCDLSDKELDEISLSDDIKEVVKQFEDRSVNNPRACLFYPVLFPCSLPIDFLSDVDYWARPEDFLKDAPFAYRIGNGETINKEKYINRK